MSAAKNGNKIKLTRPRIVAICCGIICGVVIFILGLVLYAWPAWLMGHYIGWLPWGQPYSRTRFEFRFGAVHRIVEDPGNHMQWVFGEFPDSITVTDGVRLIVYDEPKAIIKSWGDSMDAQHSSLKHKGYMGIWSEGKSFSVDSNGVVQSK